MLSASQATVGLRSWGSTFHAFIRRRTRRPRCRNSRSIRRGARGDSCRKAGGCARTAPASGPRVVLDAVHDRDGRVIGFAKVTRDMTERRAAQQACWRASGASACWCRGSSTTPSSCSTPRAGSPTGTSAPQRIKGYSAEEIIGQHFSRFYTEEDRAAGVPRSCTGTGQRREGRFEAEGWRVRKDGSRFWASVVIDAIHDDDGELVGFAKVTRDITERHEAQQALHETQRAAGAVAEDGGDRPADRRHRPRLQQSPDDRAGQRRNGAAPRSPDARDY